MRSRINMTLTYLSILHIDPLLVKPMIPELAFARVCMMRTATVDTVGLVRALCDCCVGWKDGWDGVGIALAAASDPTMFIGHMRVHAVRTGRSRGPARLRRVTPLPAALADRTPLRGWASLMRQRRLPIIKDFPIRALARAPV